MLDLVPENVGGVVVLNLKKTGPVCDPRYCDCGAFAVSVHNLMLNTELRYAIIDLQDEKEICPTFIEEMLQLWKRVRLPFLFVGVMPKVEAILKSYDYLSRYPAYISVDDAIADLRRRHPSVLTASLDGISFGQSLPVPRSRAAALALEEEEEERD